MYVCVCVCKEGWLPFNVVWKTETAASTRNILHMHVSACVWVSRAFLRTPVKLNLYFGPNSATPSSAAGKKKGATCCCNCSSCRCKKTGNAQTQTFTNDCVQAHSFTHVYVHTYVQHMQFKCPYWFPELNICKMIIHCDAGARNLCRCFCLLSLSLSSTKTFGIQKLKTYPHANQQKVLLALQMWRSTQTTHTYEYNVDISMKYIIHM